MTSNKNLSLLATATIYVGAFAGYITGIVPIAESFQSICNQLDVSQAVGAVIISIPLFFAVSSVVKSRFMSWFNKHTFAQGECYQVDTFRLRPFVESERDIEQYKKRFRGDGLEEEIVEWLIKADEPILFLTGKSGTGKSSLLSAAVIPALKKQNPLIQICSIRIFSNPIVDLQQGLERVYKAERTSPEKCSAQQIRNVLESITLKAPVLLVVDQFEELLILHSAEQRKPFEQLLRDLVSQPLNNLQVLLVCREDYLPELEQARSFLPNLRSLLNWRQVGLFKQSMATNFLNSAGINIGSQLMAKLLAEGSDVEETKGQYRPIVLNMLGLSLERNIRPQSKRFFKSPVSLLRQLVETELGSDESCRQVLIPMITDKGTKRALSVTNIAEESRLSPVTTRAALRKLESSGLVRQLNEVEHIWEISHDFIARILYSLLVKWKTSFFRRVKPWIIPMISLLLIMIMIVSESKAEKTLMLIKQLNKAGAVCTLKDSESQCGIKGTKEVPMALLLALNQQSPVTGLEMSFSSLVSLPENLGNLTDLKLLVIYAYNDLKSLPESVGKLSKLTSLVIDNSHQLESLPESIGKLTNLTQLVLTTNRLEGLPNSLGNLANLTDLDLSNNQLKSLPDNFGNLAKLTDLNLSNNQLKILPDSLDKLANLTNLDLSDNQLKSLPESIGNLANLTSLVLTTNKFEGLPDSLGNLSNLTTLDLSYGQLKSLPDSIGNLIKLTELDLTDNQLKRLPDTIGNLTNLNKLDLSDNQFKDLPGSIGNLTNLTELDLAFNQLVSLPDGFGKLTSLNKLNIIGNELESLPVNIQKIKGLRIFGKPSKP